MVKLVSLLKVAAVTVAIFSFANINTASASHGTASPVGTILGDGNGTFNGNYTHVGGSNSNHPWYTLDLGVGDTASINLSTSGWTSTFWLYQVLNEPIGPGDTLGTDYALIQQAAGAGSTNPFLSYTATLATAGQFLIQVDSWVGGSGAYTLVVSGASEQVSEPGTLAVLGLGLLGFAAYRRKNRQMAR